MKKIALVLLMVLCVTCLFCACDFMEEPCTITTEKSRYTVYVGDTVDYKSYFTITSATGENVPVTDDMISAPDADLTRPWSFLVTCDYQGVSKSIIISVENKPGAHTHQFVDATCTTPKTCSCGLTEGEALGHTEKVVDATPATCTQSGLTAGKVCSVCNEVLVAQQSVAATGHTEPNAQGRCATCGEQLLLSTLDLADAMAKCNKYEKWNFAVKFDVSVADKSLAEEYAYTYIYYYDGVNFYYSDVEGSFYDYIVYTDDNILYYLDNGNGTHSLLTAEDDAFYDWYPYLDFIELTTLVQFTFETNGNRFSASLPNAVGEEVIGGYEDCVYTAFDIYVVDDVIVKIVAVQQDYQLNTTFTYTLEFTDHGNITMDTSKLVVENNPDQGGGETPPVDTPTEYTTTFATSTGQTALSSSGEITFTANRAVDGWDSTRGLQFQKQFGSVTLTSTSTLTDVTSITMDISANKTTDITVTVKVGSTTFTCDGQSQVVFNNKINNLLTFTSATPASGEVTIMVVPAKTNASGLGSVYFKYITMLAGYTGGNTIPPVDGETMPEQVFDENNHVDYDDILYDAITDYDDKNYYLPSTGLPSQGKYNVLVVPVEFSNDVFTAQELEDIAKVFNNQSATGWQSVASYYKTSSYGKLDLTFDIADKVSLSATYQSFNKADTNGEKDYGQSIFKQALDKLDARGFDFSKYDYDNNGVIDGVYIIYSAPVDYDTTDYYWAYVTAYTADDQTEYDNLLPYTYLFASVDFAYEDIETSNPEEFSPIAGLKLNATTYIHETGHMLGLDDYYDYMPDQGSDQGLGGADMMDYTAGDHNAYSKLLLGWVKPTVVTSSQTVTINTLESSGQFIIVLLDYNGTYFSEYLIIDLYSATGLNEMHANVEGSYLYEGTKFGARIYHVDATIDIPYNENDTYGSFTDNNNSTTAHPLLKLVEADGDKNFESEGEYYQGQYYTQAGADDLWQTGDVFRNVHPYYTRHDGKEVNFDISFDSVTATSATITITFDYE